MEDLSADVHYLTAFQGRPRTGQRVLREAAVLAGGWEDPIQHAEGPAWWTGRGSARLSGTPWREDIWLQDCLQALTC